MAAYPSFTQLTGSVKTLVDDIAADRAVDGTLRQRAYFNAGKSDFSLKHLLSAADRGTLDTFYSDNRLLVVTLVWSGNGTTYNCRFKRPPQAAWSDNWWTVNVELFEV